MTLYDFDFSAECYAVRLLAALIGVPLDLHRIDVYPGREHEGEAFLALNPLGTVPVLIDEDLQLRDWRAILAHLGQRYDPYDHWWPNGDAKLVEWMGFADALGRTAGLARLHGGMGYDVDITTCRQDAHRLLRELERHLWFGERSGSDWLLPPAHPTAADIAVFVHVALCEEGGVERLDYPGVRRWIDRVRFLEGFVAMSGIFPPPTIADAPQASAIND